MAVALGVGATVALARHRRALPLGRLVFALALGSLVAAPQLVEPARLLPESMRGFWGYQEIGADARDPATLLDLLIPVFFGRPDSGAVWSGALFGGHPPLFFSLFPGLVALALALAAGRPRGADRWALAGLAPLGLVLAYSRGTWLATLSIASPAAPSSASQKSSSCCRRWLWRLAWKSNSIISI